MNSSEMIFSIIIWLVIIVSLIYLLIKKIIKEENEDFLGAPFFDSEDFFRLMLKTLFNLIVVLILARGIYYPLTKNKDYLFTYLLISLTVFILCVLL